MLSKHKTVYLWVLDFAVILCRLLQKRFNSIATMHVHYVC